MGWNGSTEGAMSMTSPQKKKKDTASSGRSYQRGLLAGLIVVALGGAAVWWFIGDGQETPHPTSVCNQVGDPLSERRITEVTNVSNSIKERVPKLPAQRIVAPEAKDDKQTDAKPKEPGVLFSSQTNNLGLIIERYRLPNGRTYRRERPLPSVLTTVSDQLLDLATSDDVGIAPPIPVSAGLVADDEFGESLKKEIVINPDDSDEVKKLKERVKAARQAMLDEMAAGKGFAEVIQEVQNAERFNRQTLDECQNEINSYLKKGDSEGAKLAYDKFSSALNEMGIQGLTLDPDPADLEDDEETATTTEEIK